MGEVLKQLRWYGMIETFHRANLDFGIVRREEIDIFGLYKASDILVVKCFFQVRL